MNSEFLVSVVIIFLNEEKFIQEAIESIFAQTYDNWELLLVDDGSTDRSSEIARHYAMRYPEKVRYLEHDGHENRGMSASRNLGLRSAKGKYISFLDGDDRWVPHKLERQLEILQSYPEAVMVCGPLYVWHSWTGKSEDMFADHLYGVGPNRLHPYGNSVVEPPKLLTLFLQDEQFIPSSILVERQVLESSGGYEDIFRDSYSDAVGLVKVCLRSSVFVSNECWYWYRKHPASSTYKSWLMGQEEAERLFYLKWIEQYFTEQGVKDREVWQALRMRLWPYRHPTLYRAREECLCIIRQTRGLARLLARQALPDSVRRWLRTQWSQRHISGNG